MPRLDGSDPVTGSDICFALNDCAGFQAPINLGDVDAPAKSSTCSLVKRNYDRNPKAKV